MSVGLPQQRNGTRRDIHPRCKQLTSNAIASVYTLLSLALNRFALASMRRMSFFVSEYE